MKLYMLYSCMCIFHTSAQKTDEYLHCSRLLKQTIDELPSPYIYILGDFKVNLGQSSILAEEFMSLCNKYFYALHIKCYYQVIFSHMLVCQMEAHHCLIIV